MRSKASSSQGGSKYMISATGRFNDGGLPEELDTLELPGNELQMNIMQECMGLTFFFWIHYTRFWFWRYSIDWQIRKVTYEGSLNGRGSANDIHGRVFKHDSIVVRIGSGRWVKAEKGGDTGITVFLEEKSDDPEEWKDPGDEEPGRYKKRFTTGVFKLGKGKKGWTVGKLRQILKLCDDPDYNIASANCWKYAYSSARAVLKWVEENAEDEQVKNRAQEKLLELARLERPMPLEVWQAIRNPFTERSQQVCKHFEEILWNTREALPAKSWVRRCGVWMILGFLRLLARIYAMVDRFGAAFASLVHRVTVGVLLAMVGVLLCMVVKWLVMDLLYMLIKWLVMVLVLIFKDRLVAVGKLVVECYRI